MLRSHVITDFLRDSGHTLRVEITYLKLKLGLPIFFLSSPFHATNDEGKHNGNLPNFNVKNLRKLTKFGKMARWRLCNHITILPILSDFFSINCFKSTIFFEEAVFNMLNHN